MNLSKEDVYKRQVFFIPIESIVFPKGNIKNVNPNTKVKILDTMIYSGYKATCMITVSYTHLY